MEPKSSGGGGTTTVFYDGGCPLCAREIAFYRRRKGAAALAWIDVSRAPEAEVAPGLSRDRALARLHVRTAGGALVSGGAAFAELWAALPGFRLIGSFCRTAAAAWLLDRAYGGFLRVRPFLQSLALRRRGAGGGGGRAGGPSRRSWLKGVARGVLPAVLTGAGLLAPMLLATGRGRAQDTQMLIDDFSRDGLVSALGTRWRGVSDRVMGGVSQVSVARDTVDGRSCVRLTGDVRLDNNGGFIQAALDLEPAGESLDASAYRGVRLVVRGNGERYSVHLRTPDNVRPWQSYRADFGTGAAWESIDIPFSAFLPYRLETPLDVRRLRRIGLVAIGRAFRADLAVAELSLYR